MRLLPGLVSITYRKLDVPAVVALAARAGLRGIEWGGDVHVPHGDLAAAAHAAALTREAGLRVAAYGTYYRLAKSEEDGLPFQRVLETANVLDAPLLRVWPGSCSSADADTAYRQAVVDNARRVADAAAAVGRRIVLEFHGGSLNDGNAAGHRLLTEINHPNVATYWQPPVGATVEYGIEGLRMLRPWIAGLHVFHWFPTAAERHPLAEGADRWRAYLAAVREVAGEGYALLEYVRDDAPDQLIPDAATLRELLEAESH